MRLTEDTDMDSVVQKIHIREGISIKDAKKVFKRYIKQERYYRDEIRKRVKVYYPDAFTIAPEASELYCIIDGQFYLFVIVKPFIGVVGTAQKRLIDRVKASGGVAAAVSWPSQAIDIICNPRLKTYY